MDTTCFVTKGTENIQFLALYVMSMCKKFPCVTQYTLESSLMLVIFFQKRRNSTLNSFYINFDAFLNILSIY